MKQVQETRLAQELQTKKAHADSAVMQKEAADRQRNEKLEHIRQELSMHEGK